MSIDAPSELLSAALAACYSAIDAHGPLWLTLFLAGLLGSATHCIGMCGPFVVSQTMVRMQTVPPHEMSEFKRLTGAALAPYHFGRATTYIVLGAVAGGLADTAMRLTGYVWISSGLLMLAAVGFALYAISRLVGRGAVTARVTRDGVASRASWMLSPLFQKPTGMRGYALGICLGFLPCGLLYAALSAAAGSGSLLAGAASMAAFSLGTVPALITVGFASRVVAQQWRGLAARALPVILLLNAATLSYMAFRLSA